jgi:hypothetical protein
MIRILQDPDQQHSFKLAGQYLERQKHGAAVGTSPFSGRVGGWCCGDRVSEMVNPTIVYPLILPNKRIQVTYRAIFTSRSRMTNEGGMSGSSSSSFCCSSEGGGSSTGSGSSRGSVGISSRCSSCGGKGMMASVLESTSTDSKNLNLSSLFLRIIMIHLNICVLKKIKQLCFKFDTYALWKSSTNFF